MAVDTWLHLVKRLPVVPAASGHWHNFSLSVSEAVGGTCCLLTTSTVTMASFHPTAAHSFANYVFLENREDGGNRLADKLLRYKGKSDQVTVVALPRGGVVTGYYIAKGLGLPLDVIIARKIGCPFHEELALGEHFPSCTITLVNVFPPGKGALTQDGSCELNEKLMQRFSLKSSDLTSTIEKERKEADRRANVYRGGRPPLDVRGKVVILVDDGIATGATAKAALLSLRKR